ncbi:MAG TPA: TolC family outer membrane protein [Albitalea sp.]|nr:TolC family outer membrane protein [Albitalea sp.]
MAIAAALAMLCGTGGATDLMDAYAGAREIDSRMLAANEALQAGREKAIQGRALSRPKVSLSGSVVHVDEKSSAELPAALSGLIKPESSGRVQQVALQLVHPLYDSRSRVERAQLAHQATLAEIGHRHAAQELMQRVGEAYFGVLLAHEHVRVVQAEKVAVAMQLERAKARFEVGRARITDLQEAQARHDNVVAKEVVTGSTLALRRMQYLELTGAPADELAALRPGFAPTAPHSDRLEEWLLKAAVGNARVQSREVELAIATAEIEKYRLSGRPTIDLVASVTRKGQSGGLSPLVAMDGSRSAVLGLQLNVPLYTGGALESRRVESMARKRQAEHDLDTARSDTRLQVHEAFLAVVTSVSRIAALAQSVLSAQSALDATVLGRDLGTRTEVDVLDAQQRLFSAQFELVQARNDYMLGRIRLAAAAGDLQEGDLHGLNALLVH